MAGRQRAKTRAHFDTLAPVYDELRGPGPEGVPPLVESLVAAGDLAGRHVLDVGCGTGRTLSTLATLAAHAPTRRSSTSTSTSTNAASSERNVNCPTRCATSSSCCW